MTNFEELKTRIIIAQSIGLAPDDVEMLAEGLKEEYSIYSFYTLHHFKENHMLLGFDSVPTISKVREQVKDLYLIMAEMDFDEEMLNLDKEMKDV